MKKKIIAVLMLFMILLSGCSGTKEAVSAENAVTFTDDLGREVTVDNPKRVAALLPRCGNWPAAK